MTIGIPLLGVPATTREVLHDGVRLVPAIDASIVVAAALLVAVGLRRHRRTV
ncbi:hypothetical protein [Streptomyces sp. NPDC091212]|uniref:hypothetical protein n=1 Tax=Streptomyces sp. NPDC091212 TaxID=3155191 RepID=UPI00343B6676